MSKKGGVGKSTITCALALYLAERGGKRVAVQDMDLNESSSSFVQHVQHPYLSQYDPDIDYDYLLIDSEGNISPDELEQVEEVADLVIIPMALTPLDIAITYATEQVLSEPAKARLLLNKVRTNTTAWRHRADALSEFHISPLRTHIVRRTCYSNFLTSGWRALDKAAIGELEGLAWEVS